jgi:hypothetical protein
MMLVGHHRDYLSLDKPATYHLVEYEARLNQVLSQYDDPVICNYNCRPQDCPNSSGSRVPTSQ